MIIINKNAIKGGILQITLLVALFCCKEATTKANPIISKEVHRKVKSNYNSTEWELKDITRFFDKPIVISEVDILKKNKISFDGNSMIINNSKANFSKQKIDPHKILGKVSLYYFFKDYIKKKYDLELASEVEYIDITYEDSVKEPFKEFFLKGNSAIKIENYLFLYSNNDYLLTYINKSNTKIDNKFNDFLNKIPTLSLPINTSNLKKGKTTDNTFFNYDYDSKYYKMDDFNVIGKFDNSNTQNVLYNLDLIGEGEGFEENMTILISYNNAGQIINNIVVGGRSGGEGQIDTFSSIITPEYILIEKAESYLESATGLPYPVTLEKKINYEFIEGMYKLVSEKFNCKESLNQYTISLKKAFESRREDIINGDYVYRLKAIKSCYPISNGNIIVYNDIAFYLLDTGQLQFSLELINEILKISPSRTVAWLNLADNYWQLDEKSKAKEAYEKYIELMKSQNKDLSKIPQRVYDRSK